MAFKYDLDFWKASAERTVKTVAQTGVAVIGVYVTGIPEGDVAGLHNIEWLSVGSAAALAGVLSLLTSLGFGAKDGQPSAGTLEALSSHAYIKVVPQLDMTSATAEIERVQDEVSKRRVKSKVPKVEVDTDDEPELRRPLPRR